MKRLILLRHAKAVPAGSAPDRDRDLAPRGLANAAWAGRRMAAAGWLPDAALVSDALRTRRTFEEALPALHPGPALHLTPRLYEASVATILSCIAAVADEVACLLVIGHNPGIAETALRLARAGEPGDLARLARGFPTATLAMLSGAADSWQGLADTGATLDILATPD